MNLYVSVFDINITEEELRKLFSEYGVISSVKLITDYNTGQSRGFAFIEMPDDTDALKAISQLDKSVQNDKTMSVQTARPKEEGKPSAPKWDKPNR